MKAIITGLAGLSLATVSFPAQGQDANEDRVTLNILRECARIADMQSRVACYDRNIGTPVARADEREVAGRAPTVPPAPPPPSFGSNNLPPARNVATPRAADEIRAQVAEARELQPGIFLLTLDNGTQWQFVDAMPFSYAPPRAGGTVEIAAAAMGSYQMRYQGQRQVRIRRVK